VARLCHIHPCHIHDMPSLHGASSGSSSDHLSGRPGRGCTAPPAGTGRAPTSTAPRSQRPRLRMLVVRRCWSACWHVATVAWCLLCLAWPLRPHTQHGVLPWRHHSCDVSARRLRATGRRTTYPGCCSGALPLTEVAAAARRCCIGCTARRCCASSPRPGCCSACSAPEPTRAHATARARPRGSGRSRRRRTTRPCCADGPTATTSTGSGALVRSLLPLSRVVRARARAAALA
jgi:hypothetical protein